MKKYLTELKIIIGILPDKLKKRMKLLLSMLSISGFLESLSIGLFITFIFFKSIICDNSFISTFIKPPC